MNKVIHNTLISQWLESDSPWPDLPYWVRFVMIIVAVGLAMSIAVGTRQDAHPDEIFHISTFDYYRNHWWPPDFDEDVTLVSIFGTKRVYSGELVYLIYSKPARVIWNILNIPQDRYIVYRLINVSVLLILLFVLFFSRIKVLDPVFIGLTILVFPQVQYIFAYVNTDAWSLSMGIFLFLVVLYLVDKPIKSWGYKDVILLGVFTGLVLASKLNFLMMLIMPYVILAAYVARSYKEKILPPAKSILLNIMLVIVIAFLFFGPLRVVFPLSIPNYSQKMQVDIRKWAYGGYNPDNPTAQGFHLAEKGVTYVEMLTEYDWMNTNRKWIPTTAKSFFGLFGYYTVLLDDWVYLLALIFVLGLLALTLITLFCYWKSLSWVMQVSFIVAPLLIMFNIAASLYRSLNYDYQPQGRYLFPSLIPVAFLLLGTIKFDRGWVKLLRLIVFGLLYFVSLYALYFAVNTPILK